jgi:hypothetical protein
MMELKRRHDLVALVVAGVALALAFGVAGCSRHADSADRAVSASSSVGSTAAPAAADLRRAVAAIFARRASGSVGSTVPLSAALLGDNVMSRRFLEIAGATDVRPRVADVRGRDVDLTIDYALVSDMKVKMLFTRRDTWTFARGSTGWLLDGVHVNDKVLEGIVYPDGSREKVADSRYDPASGSVTFSMRGARYVWTPAAQWTWKIAALSTPKPMPASIAPETPVPSPSPSDGIATQVPLVQTAPPATTAQPRASPKHEPLKRPAAEHVPVAARTPPAGMIRVARDSRAAPTRPPAYVAASPYGDCSTETVDSVSEDGSVVTLADGRRYLVREQERYLSSLWVAGDAVTLCDPGPGMNARLTRHADVIYAGHIE